MNQFYILEIQKYNVTTDQDGTPTGDEYGHIVHFAYDADPTKARLKAEAKYHEVLAAAAVSELPQHSATLITSDGRVIMNQCYVHAVTPAPTDDTEPIDE